jgi:uncharacterized UBP type Zn finger protein
MDGKKYEKTVNDINTPLKMYVGELLSEFGLLENEIIQIKFINCGQVFTEDRLLKELNLKSPIVILAKRKEFTKPNEEGSSSTTKPSNSSMDSDTEAKKIQKLFGFLLMSLAVNRDATELFNREPSELVARIMESKNVSEFIKSWLPKIEEFDEIIKANTNSDRTIVFKFPILDIDIGGHAQPLPVIQDHQIPVIPLVNVENNHPQNNFTSTDLENINKLIEFGFPKNEVILAYIRTGKDTNAAANALFESQHFDHEEDIH